MHAYSNRPTARQVLSEAVIRDRLNRRRCRRDMKSWVVFWHKPHFRWCWFPEMRTIDLRVVSCRCLDSRFVCLREGRWGECPCILGGGDTLTLNNEIFHFLPDPPCCSSSSFSRLPFGRNGLMLQVSRLIISRMDQSLCSSSSASSLAFCCSCSSPILIRFLLPQVRKHRKSRRTICMYCFEVDCWSFRFSTLELKIEYTEVSKSNYTS